MSRTITDRGSRTREVLGLDTPAGSPGALLSHQQGHGLLLAALTATVRFQLLALHF